MTRFGVPLAAGRSAPFSFPSLSPSSLPFPDDDRVPTAAALAVEGLEDEEVSDAAEVALEDDDADEELELEEEEEEEEWEEVVEVPAAAPSPAAVATLDPPLVRSRSASMNLRIKGWRRACLAVNLFSGS